MMGALGNGRRGGRSPSLLVAALIACILLLGFNYWVSNSRNIKLQSKLLEMEGHMRLLAADRDREQQSKIKAEEETRRQNQQLDLIENTYHAQQEGALNAWKQEKENLKLNISISTKTVQGMKNHMKSLMEDLSKMQSELKSCKSNFDILNKKATKDLTQCDKQIVAMQEECSQKIAAARLENPKKPEKEHLPETPQNPTGSKTQKASDSKAKSVVLPTNHANKSAGEPSNIKSNVNSHPKNDARLQNNETVVGKDKKDAVILKKSPMPISKPTIKNETVNKPANEEVLNAVKDIKGESLKAAGGEEDADTLLDQAGILETKEDDIGFGIGDGNEGDAGIAVRREEDGRIGEGKDEDAIMYDNEGEIEKQLSKIKDENPGGGQDMEDDFANYNGDNNNQPESEDDKQAELVGM
ncbi:Golgi membrane protein 1-like [Myxocyprinus asiaticus]|uniref:Golgi membrane protein 1-like n=1 Tax=Myxocyprinus asiaticus TaxID=70543 RepID=UPI002221AA14|nr:Golgi membrane protein 1-like [Myxocyprinus asiaticus]